MCGVCKRVAGLPPKAALTEIGKVIGEGRDPEHFKVVIDSILGTQEPEVDKERDLVWERSHRGNRGR
jgi:hypothetical protein